MKCTLAHAFAIVNVSSADVYVFLCAACAAVEAIECIAVL